MSLFRNCNCLRWRGFLLGTLVFLFIFTSKGYAEVSTSISASEIDLFKSAEEAREAFNWDEALAKYRQLVEEHPDSPLAPKAHLQLGKALKDDMFFDEAIAHYKQTIAKAPGTRPAKAAKAGIAEAYYLDDYLDEALLAFQGLLDETTEWDLVKFSSNYIRDIKRRKNFASYTMSQCGPKALAVICQLNDIKATTEELAELMKLDNRGASLEDLKKVSTVKGLKSNGVMLTVAQLKTVKKPLIALLKNAHYVVITGFDEKNGMNYIDADKGQAILAMSENSFQKMWNGQALVFQNKQDLGPEVAFLSEDMMIEARGKHHWCHGTCPDEQYGGGDFKNTYYDKENPCGPGMPAISVNTTTGNLVIEDIDLSYNGRGPKIEIKRTFNNYSPEDSSFGHSWTFNYNVWLQKLASDEVEVHRGTGRIDNFESIGSGEYIYPYGGIYDSLSKNVDGTWSLEIKDDKTTQNFDASGKLISIVDQNINTVTIQGVKNPLLTIEGTGGIGEFKLPNGITTDSSGNVYVADTLNNAIQKFDSNGNFELEWSTWVSGGTFSYPQDVAVYSSGYIYVSDGGNDRIVKFDGSGSFELEWSTWGSGDSFSSPEGTTIDSSGYVYVADTNNDRIVKFDGSGSFELEWSDCSSGDTLDMPRKLTVDSSGNIYVVDSGNRIVKFDSNGDYDSEWSCISVHDVTADNSGYIYAASYYKIWKYDSDSTLITSWGSYGKGDGEFKGQSGITVDSSNYVYVTDSGNYRIQKFENDGDFVKKWGTYGLPNGELSFPTDVTVDSSGNIYVVDNGNRRVVKLDSNGNFIKKWGNVGAGYDNFDSPRSIAFDSSGNMYVTDYNNNHYGVVKFDSNGDYVTDFGSKKHTGIAINSSDDIYVTISNDVTGYCPVYRLDTDGNLELEWSTWGSGDTFRYPQGIAVDSSGYVYVADSGNDRIVKFDGSGNFELEWSTWGSGNTFNGPTGISVDSNDYVYVADRVNHRIVKFDSEGNFVNTWGSSGSENGEFSYPNGVFVDSSGYAYVSDSSNNRIVKFDPDYPFWFTPISIIDAAGRETTFKYENSRIVSVVAPDGRTAHYSYDASGNMTSTIDMEGNPVYYKYDEDSYIVTINTPKGTTNITYYSGVPGALITIINPDGIIKTYESDTTPYTEITDGNGNTTTYKYNQEEGYTEAITDALDNEINFGYDGNGNRNSITDANGHTYSIVYDGNGNITSMTSPVGRTINAEYDSNDNLTTLTDPEGHTIDFYYDENSNISSIGAPATLYKFTYNAYGELTSMSDALENTATFSYDSDGNLAGITNAQDETSYIFSHDMVGRVMKVTDRDGNATRYQYNDIDKITQINHPIGIRQFAYECCGLYSFTDEEGKTTNFAYKSTDGLTAQVLAEVTDSLLGTTGYGYDDAFNLTSVSNALNNAMGYSYDAADRLVEDADQTIYSHDKAGNILRRTDAESNIVRYTYDDDNWLTSINYPDATDVGFTYNDNSNLTGMTDANGDSSYIYTFIAGANRLASMTDSYLNTIQYGYNAVGNLFSITYPDNKIVSYGYDELHRLTRVTDWSNNVTTYDYLFDSYIHTITYPNEVTTAYEYDSNWRLTSMVTKTSDDTVIASYAYTLDAVGNRTQVDSEIFSGIPSGSTTYTYNTDNQLVSANADSMLYSYDDNGNLVEKTIDSTTTNYSYDYENRLVLVDDGIGSTRYKYDGLGNRIAKTVDGTTTRYVVNTNNPLSQVIAETNTVGSITAYYVYGLGLLAKITTEDEYYYHYDGLGSTVAMTDSSISSTNIVNKYAYDSYGKILENTEGVSNPFKYVGEFGVMDDGDDLYYMRARYYDAQMKRFINKDPYWGSLWYPKSLHRYAYVEGNPVNFIDPTGLLGIILPPLYKPILNCKLRCADRYFPLFIICLTPPNYLLRGLCIYFYNKVVRKCIENCKKCPNPYRQA